MDIEYDINEHIEALSSLNTKLLDEYKNIVKTAIKEGRTIFTAGNGGSASDSAHLTGEIVGKFMIERRGYPAIDLASNNTVITAVGNDYNYNEIFSRQLIASAKKDDLLIVFTTSGNSSNIVEALITAKKIGMETIVVSGKDGGVITNKGFGSLIVKSNSTPVIQCVHTFILHQLAYAVDEAHLEMQ